MEGFLLVGSVLKMLIRFLGTADICLKFSDAGVIRVQCVGSVCHIPVSDVMRYRIISLLQIVVRSL